MIEVGKRARRTLNLSLSKIYSSLHSLTYAAHQVCIQPYQRLNRERYN